VKQLSALEEDAWVAALHGIEQCGRHDPNCAWLGCSKCCEVVAKTIRKYIIEGKLKVG
jgi:hypothetical protein